MQQTKSDIFFWFSNLNTRTKTLPTSYFLTDEESASVARVPCPLIIGTVLVKDLVVNVWGEGASQQCDQVPHYLLILRPLPVPTAEIPVACQEGGLTTQTEIKYYITLIFFMLEIVVSTD